MRKKSAIVLLLSILAACLGVASSASAAPSPAWSIAVSGYPTNFAPGAKANLGGPGYVTVVRNVGGAPTSGAFTITNTLPGGLSPVSVDVNSEWKNPLCHITGRVISCEKSTPFYPGEMAEVRIQVEVLGSAPPSVTDEVTVEGGGATPASGAVVTPISQELAAFGFLEGGGAFGSITNADGATVTQAGSHPYQLTVAFALKDVMKTEESNVLRVAGGGLRGISGDLPPGIAVNPAATPKCTEAELESFTGCPPASQIGLMRTVVSIFPTPGSFLSPLYNMESTPGTPAIFGYEVIEGVYVHLIGRVRSDGNYGLSADVLNIPAKAGILGAEVMLWGDPTDESHDQTRGRCAAKGGACASERLDTAFVTMPSSCTSGQIETGFMAANWIGQEANTSYPSTDLNGNPVGVDGCNQLEFEPTIESRPTTNLADSPSGLEFNLHQRQELKVDGRSTANLKDTTVTLPAGMALNPSAGNGLAACSEAQLGSNGAEPAKCPDASKIGSVEVTTPLLENPLEGAVYLATPFQNPFDSQYAIYIAVEDPLTGVVAKLPGKVVADASTGQLTTRVEESPELPLEDVAIKFFGGPRAALSTPPVCGTYTTTSDLTPWSTPEGADAHPVDSFQTTASPTGGSCPTSEGGMPNHPSFTAGTVSPQAGAYSPFVLKISREDGTQRLSRVDTTLPKGLTGKLAGIPYCSEAAIAQAKAREAPNQGAAEQQSPSCPKASEVGTVDVGAGSGITPFHAGGHAYLAGPYKGAPLSLVIITPAVAGPFDLGAVVVRTALNVDPETAKIHAVSDPLPQIIDGIPLDVRSVSIELGRPQFSLNPTSCDPSAVLGSIASPLGSAAVSSPFQVGGCSSLPFKPKLAITLKGGTKRGDFPALTATATAKPGEANIGRVSVELPHSAFLEQSHIGTVCTRVQFNQGSVPGAACPARSIYGKATLKTPLLDQPLTGPVFLRSSSHKLPDLVVALHGQVDVVVAGKVDSVKGALRNTFEAVPDAPFSKFTLQMQGGKKGLIVNSRNLCAAANKATVQMDGQNGKAWDTTPVVKAKCGRKGRKGGKKKAARHRG